MGRMRAGELLCGGNTRSIVKAPSNKANQNGFLLLFKRNPPILVRDMKHFNNRLIHFNRTTFQKWNIKCIGGARLHEALGPSPMGESAGT